VILKEASGGNKKDPILLMIESFKCYCMF